MQCVHSHIFMPALHQILQGECSTQTTPSTHTNLDCPVGYTIHTMLGVVATGSTRAMLKNQDSHSLARLVANYCISGHPSSKQPTRGVSVVLEMDKSWFPITLITSFSLDKTNFLIPVHDIEYPQTAMLYQTVELLAIIIEEAYIFHFLSILKGKSTTYLRRSQLPKPPTRNNTRATLRNFTSFGFTLSLFLSLSLSHTQTHSLTFSLSFSSFPSPSLILQSISCLQHNRSSHKAGTNKLTCKSNFDEWLAICGSD